MSSTRSTLEQIDLTNLVAYLRHHGWEATDRWRLATVWRRLVDESETEILVPDRDAADFRTRVDDVLQQVAKVEARAIESLVRDVQTTLHDVIRVAAQTTTGAVSVPIETGVHLVRGAEAMLLAAASAAVTRRSLFPTRKPAPAIEYMRHVQLGQTEPGSFVVTLLSPVSPTLQTGVFPELVGDPFERTVTTLLAQAVETARSAADQAVADGTLEVFANTVEAGVSANLCEALADLLPPDAGTQSVRIGIRWSPFGPTPRASVSSATLGTDLAPVFREAARFFREAVPQPDYELTGYVVRLQHDPEPGTFGEISILNAGADSPRVIAVRLPPDDYQAAIIAHRDIRLVSVRGRLVRTGPRATLEDPTEFALAGEPPPPS